MLDSTILSMRVDMSRWSYYSTWRCWCERHTIEGRLNEFSASLRQCLDLLGLAADLEGINQVAEVKEMVAEDKRHINTIENQVNEIHKIVTELQTTRTTATPGSPEHAEATTALLHISVSPEPYVLRPPDLKGDVQKIGDYPISFGSKYDTYKGLFLGEVFVAMKFLRGPGMTGEKTEDDIRRFDRQVDLWRTLKHKHVLDLTGYCILNGNEMCLVSPWMENRDVVWYLNKNPNANRFQLITDIALGLKYLHSINTLHGGLQPKNTLVSKEAYAVLGGFSLAKLLRDDEPTFFSQSDGPVSGFRYQPPEVIGGQPLTPSSDVYSWAMCALEIMTGRELISNILVLLRVHI
ncbi:hypothetical protein FRC02_006810 [Tulasnella sp. 418]|nr:hypothetical protein FRC02_006810 [Tulasnella sp. 418]